MQAGNWEEVELVELAEVEPVVQVVWMVAVEEVGAKVVELVEVELAGG